MNETLADFLNSQKADADTIQQAARLYLSEKTGDLSTAEMMTQVETAAGGNEKLISAASEELAGNLEAGQDIILEFFADEWEDADARERIQRAFAAAHEKLPLIEIVAVTAVTLYAMYLTARLADPDIGKKKERRRIKRNADGSYESDKVTEWHSQDGPLSAIGKLFQLISGEKKD